MQAVLAATDVANLPQYRSTLSTNHKMCERWHPRSHTYKQQQRTAQVRERGLGLPVEIVQQPVVVARHSQMDAEQFNNGYETSEMDDSTVYLGVVRADRPPSPTSSIRCDQPAVVMRSALRAEKGFLLS
jgi:hypothetical protein